MDSTCNVVWLFLCWSKSWFHQFFICRLWTTSTQKVSLARNIVSMKIQVGEIWWNRPRIFCFDLLMEEILHQLIGSLSNYLQVFLHPRWVFSISAPSTAVTWIPNPEVGVMRYTYGDKMKVEWLCKEAGIFDVSEVWRKGAILSLWNVLKKL